MTAVSPPPGDDRGRQITGVEARRIADEVLRENEQRRLPPADDQAELAAAAYACTAEADPELTGYYELSPHSLRSTGWALHGAGWATPDEARALRARVAAVRALADEMATEEFAAAGSYPTSAGPLGTPSMRIRAVLDGPAEAPADGRTVQGTMAGHPTGIHFYRDCPHCSSPVSVVPAEAAEPHPWEAEAALPGEWAEVERDAQRWRERAPEPAPAPGYPRIADAITAACEAADIDLTVVHDGRVLDYVPGVVWLATVLDKAGLIDWSAFQDEGGVTVTPAEPRPPTITETGDVVIRAAILWAIGPHPYWDNDNRLLGAVAAYRAALSEEDR